MKNENEIEMNFENIENIEKKEDKKEEDNAKFKDNSVQSLCNLN